MNVKAIADLHGFLPEPAEIAPADLLLIGGDVCPDFHRRSRARYGEGREPYAAGAKRGSYEQGNWLDSDFRPWLEKLRALGVEEIVGIAGNHDFVFEDKGLVPDDLPWSYLEDSGCVVGGVHIWGVPWVPNLFPRWAFSPPPPFQGVDRLALAYDAVPDDTDLLLSHGPPYGYLDFVAPQFGSTHVGASQANDALIRVQPKVFICGHIHEQGHRSETHRRSGTILYNVAHVNESYEGFRGAVALPEWLWEQ